MSYKANVYNVMIASPSDVAKERTKVVEALAEWNRHNTAERKCVFLPLRWEEDSAARMGCPPQETLNRQLCERSDCDILDKAWDTDRRFCQWHGGGD